MSPTATNPALTNGPLNTFLGQVESQILVPIMTLLALVAFVVMIWGVVDYIRQADNPEARSVGARHMIWGFVGLVIIFGATAIINLITLLIQVF